MENKIVVTPAMIEAAHAVLDKQSSGFSCAAVYGAMERARRKEVACPNDGCGLSLAEAWLYECGCDWSEREG